MNHSLLELIHLGVVFSFGEGGGGGTNSEGKIFRPMKMLVFAMIIVCWDWG